MIVRYLRDCSRGLQQGHWQSSVIRLVRLIRRFPNANHVDELRDIIGFGAECIPEYASKVIPAAQMELHALLPRGYSIEQAVEEFRGAFFPTFNLDEIRSIGQRVWDANVLNKGGLFGLHQTYHAFVTKMPACGGTFSRLWDGIGDWAD
jgi:hypothetical protein